MSDQPIQLNLFGATSLPASADGSSPCSSQAGQQTEKSGPEAVSKTAGWNVTRITDDATITHGGYPYDSRRVSKGQRFRVRCALQIAFAQIQGCKLIVIDAADIMDGPGRKGLITVLKAYGIAAVISMTYNKRDDVQPFTTLDGFKVYWLDQRAQLLEKVAA